MWHILFFYAHIDENYFMVMMQGIYFNRKTNLEYKGLLTCKANLGHFSSKFLAVGIPTPCHNRDIILCLIKLIFFLFAYYVSDDRKEMRGKGTNETCSICVVVFNISMTPLLQN